MSAHTFSLRPCDSNLYYKHAVEIDLTPVNLADVAAKIHPQFNNDQKHYTPAFVVPCDLLIIPNYHIIAQALFEERINEAAKVMTTLEMEMGEPSKANRKCGVCKSKYLKYSDHIRTKVHKKNIKDSEFDQDLYNMCRLYPNSLQEFPLRKPKRRIAKKPAPLRFIKKLSFQTETADPVSLVKHSVQGWSTTTYMDGLIHAQLQELQQVQINNLGNLNLGLVFLQTTPMIRRLLA